MDRIAKICISLALPMAFGIEQLNAGGEIVNDSKNVSRHIFKRGNKKTCGQNKNRDFYRVVPMKNGFDSKVVDDESEPKDEYCRPLNMIALRRKVEKSSKEDVVAMIRKFLSCGDSLSLKWVVSSMIYPDSLEIIAALTKREVIRLLELLISFQNKACAPRIVLHLEENNQLKKVRRMARNKKIGNPVVYEYIRKLTNMLL
ncbi:MAG: hypothetical protein LBH49_00590 [Puniceicoccales bacterium]|nr:hypothetical protein [Puniceicoccales bacterium]